MEYEVEGTKHRGRPKRTCREVVKNDCQARKLNKADGVDRSKWRKLIKDVRRSGWVWLGECFFWYRPTWAVPDQRLLNGCVCVCVCCTKKCNKIRDSRDWTDVQLRISWQHSATHHHSETHGRTEAAGETWGIFVLHTPKLNKYTCQQSASSSRQITTPTPHHLTTGIFPAGMH